MSDLPWYRRARRWGQLNLVEQDPLGIDLDWVAAQWRRTAVEGVILNAGGIVAYYPSAVADHYRAAGLGDRDLLGELVALARRMDLAVLARMDSNRALPALHARHPEWFACDHAGHPYYTGERERYLACINGGYYHEHLPLVLREIIERYRPDGITDNSWTGLGPEAICHCASCREGFAAETGGELPRAADWGDPSYRRWYRWSIACRSRLWRANQARCRDAGGADCLWLGMVHADPIRGHVHFADLAELLDGQPVVMTDHQSRDPLNGFEQNASNGLLLHDLAGWDALIPESMACYVRSGGRTFRQTSAAPEEARAWMRSGIAGGLAPWWHHVGAVQGDRRQFAIAEPVFTWHRDHQDLLHDRRPVADVGLLWSQDHIHFGGRDQAHERVALPWNGWVRALGRAGLPWRPLHVRRLDRAAPRLLILPDLACLRDDELLAIRRHVEAGGALIASGRSGRDDQDGEPRADWPLAELLGIAPSGVTYGVGGSYDLDWEHHQRHNYLRIDDPRHPLLAAFADSDRLALGGTVQGVRVVAEDARPLTHYIPAYPLYPPEFAWPRQELPQVPGLVLREHPAGGRLVYLAADLDRAYGRSALPDHGELLAAIVRWALAGPATVELDAPGRVDLRCWRQDHAAGERLLIHLVNHSHSAGQDCREDTLPVGPLSLRCALPLEGLARCAVTGDSYPLRRDGACTGIELPRLAEHALLEIALGAS